jgi:hypothetical protein
MLKAKFFILMKYQFFLGNLSNVEKQEIKTVRIVKRESERRQRDRERSLQPMTDWSTNNVSANLDQFIDDELVHSLNYTRASSVPRQTDFSKFEEYYSKPQPEPPNYLRLNDKNMDLSPKYPSSPSLSNYDYSRDMSSLSSSYQKSYDKSMYDRTVSISTQYLNSPTDSSRTLTNDPISKTSSITSLTRSHMELSPIFKSEAAKQIITEMSGEPKNGSLHRRQVPKEKRRHYTAPHHLSAKTLNELPKMGYNQDVSINFYSYKLIWIIFRELKFIYGWFCLTVCYLSCLVWCPGQNKRTVALSFFDGCRKKRLKD